MLRWPAVLLGGTLFVVVFVTAAAAGLEEGRRAFENGDYAVAYRHLRPLAEAGNIEAQFSLGMLFSHAGGALRDYRQAADWYGRAARNGHGDAQFALGFLYYTGAGALGAEGGLLRPDYAAAARWLKRAAEGGNGLAQHLIAGMYQFGLGVARDPVLALKWTLAAAEQGVVGAQYDAGLYYAGAISDAATDEVEAYKWFRLAAEQGYPGARANLRILEKRLSAEQRAAAEARIERWRNR